MSLEKLVRLSWMKKIVPCLMSYMIASESHICFCIYSFGIFGAILLCFHVPASALNFLCYWMWYQSVSLPSDNVSCCCHHINSIRRCSFPSKSFSKIYICLGRHILMFGMVLEEKNASCSWIIQDWLHHGRLFWPLDHGGTFTNIAGQDQTLHSLIRINTIATNSTVISVKHIFDVPDTS